jgi:hypothetical protein
MPNLKVEHFSVVTNRREKNQGNSIAKVVEKVALGSYGLFVHLLLI